MRLHSHHSHVGHLTPSSVVSIWSIWVFGVIRTLSGQLWVIWVMDVELDLSLKSREVLSVDTVSESPEAPFPDQVRLSILQTKVVFVVDTLG